LRRKWFKFFFYRINYYFNFWKCISLSYSSLSY
jgi:hypothetical protein